MCLHLYYGSCTNFIDLFSWLSASRAEFVICEPGPGSGIYRESLIEKWRNGTWRINLSTYRKVGRLCYLEPIRHIEYMVKLDGRELLEFGYILSLGSRFIKMATVAKLFYVYIYEDHISCHLGIAPCILIEMFIAMTSSKAVLQCR